MWPIHLEIQGQEYMKYIDEKSWQVKYLENNIKLNYKIGMKYSSEQVSLIRTQNKLCVSAVIMF